MTVFCPFCARTLIPAAGPRLKAESVACIDCEMRFELTTWPRLPGLRAAEATLEAVESLVPF